MEGNVPALSLDPALWALIAVMLIAALWRDARYHRIDNRITFTGAIGGVAINSYLSGFSGAVSALAGLGVGLCVLMPFYLRRGMSAGDVKLMGALGACLGPVLVFWAAAYTLVTGLLLAVFMLGLRGEIINGLGHMGRQMRAYALTRVWAPAPAGAAMARRFPYATAITAGCCLLALLGVPAG